MTFQQMVGKTISSIDDTAQNCAIFHFTDGTRCEVFAECGSGDFDIPFFDVHEVSNSELNSEKA